MCQRYFYYSPGCVLLRRYTLVGIVGAGLGVGGLFKTGKNPDGSSSGSEKVNTLVRLIGFWFCMCPPVIIIIANIS